jgi:TIR domain/NACHT domain
MSEKRSFFISRAGADKPWAELIAGVVRDAGYEAVYQDQDFCDGTSFSHNMMLSAQSDCTIAVLSPDYFESEYCLAELHAALASDPIGVHGRILPVRVAPFELPRLLGHLTYVDLAGRDEDAARGRLKVALLKHGKPAPAKTALRSQSRRHVEQASRNRDAMIEKVWTIWIRGFLEQSLFHETRVVLGLSERPDAVARPLDLLVRRPDASERPLPRGISILELFDTMDRSLVILGAPGSGKTTLLLELARSLLSIAKDDPAHPIPVVFPLSTWSQSGKPLSEWLSDELNLRYGVPRNVANDWIKNDAVLPLLDGLDEVTITQRVACVESINAFRQSHGFLPVAVTSRTSDYEGLIEPLRLQGAVLVRPLTHEQVEAYLADLGVAGDRARSALHDDSSLWELLDTPLLLNMVAVVYSTQPEGPPQISVTTAERREHLFSSYVEKMLARHSEQGFYTSEQTVRWLSWLAYQMAVHGHTIFFLERVQGDWLPRRERWRAQACTLLASALCGGLVGAIGFDVGYGSLLVALGAVLSGELPDLEWVSQVVQYFQFYGLAGGLLVGLVVGLVFLPREIVCVETVRWSWRRSLIAAAFLVVGGPVVGLAFGLLFQGREAITIGLVIGLVIGLLFGVLAAPARGLIAGQIDTKSVPNEGIYRSLKRSVVCAIVFELLEVIGFGLLFVALALWGMGALAGLFMGSVGIPVIALVGTFVGLITGLIAGGEACLKHLVIRLWLVKNGSTPWNYVRFLDHSAGRILLRKVGGGYAFLHRLLLEHLAARHAELSADVAIRVIPTSIDGGDSVPHESVAQQVPGSVKNAAPRLERTVGVLNVALGFLAPFLLSLALLMAMRPPLPSDGPTSAASEMAVWTCVATGAILGVVQVGAGWYLLSMRRGARSVASAHAVANVIVLVLFYLFGLVFFGKTDTADYVVSTLAVVVGCVYPAVVWRVLSRGKPRNQSESAPKTD